MGTTSDKLDRVLQTKSELRSAIVSKGQSITDDTPFKDYPGKVAAIKTGSDTSDATATRSDILSGKTAYISSGKVSGSMVNRGAVNTTITAPDSYTIPAGYHNGSGKVTASAGPFSDQTQADAVAADLISGKTAWVNGSKITGSLSVAGKTFVETPIPGSISVAGMTYGNGRFVIIGSNTNKLYYSYDLVNWTAGTLPSSSYWGGICYGADGKFILANHNSNKIYYSYDLVNWTSATLSTSLSLGRIAYGNGKFVAVTDGNSSNTNSTGFVSSDGITWTKFTLPDTEMHYSIIFGRGKFIIVNPNCILKSTDGETWVKQTVGFSAGRSIAYGNNRFIIGSYNEKYIWYSETGDSWTRASPSNMSTNAQSLSYGNGVFLCVDSDVIKSSVDGMTWSKVLYTCTGSAGFNNMFYHDAFLIKTTEKLIYSKTI